VTVKREATLKIKRWLWRQTVETATSKTTGAGEQAKNGGRRLGKRAWCCGAGEHGLEQQAGDIARGIDQANWT